MDSTISQAGLREKPPYVEGQTTARLAPGPEAAETLASLWKENGVGGLGLFWGPMLPQTAPSSEAALHP